MKKALIVFFALLFCLAAGLVLFIATFNADQYRPTVVKKVSEALGTPVDLGRLSLVWKNGIALRLDNFTIYSDAGKKNKAVQLPVASVVVRLMPLLHKDVQVASVSLIKPAVRIVRNADGVVEVPGVRMPAPAAGPAGPSKKNAPAGGPSMLLSVDSFTITDGWVDFVDQSPANPLTLPVRQLDVKVKNFSMTRPFSFDVAAAVFSAKQNIHLSGRLKLPQAGQKGTLEKAVFQTGLADWDLEALAKALPAIRSAGLEGNMGGKLELQIERMDLDEHAAQSLKASAKLQNGAVKLQSMKSPFEKIQLNARVSGPEIDIEDFSSNFAKGTLKASGTVHKFQMQASDLSIDELVPEGARNAPHLGGHLSLEFTGGAAGPQWAQISQTLSGQGHFSLKDGVLLNYNLLREVIEKISIIPGAEGVLQQQLPGLYKAKMGEPSTLFQPIDLPFTARNGTIFFDRLVLATDLLLLEGSGQVGLDKAIQARTDLRMSRDLSGVLVQILPQAQLLANPQGELQIPIQIQGVLPQVSILPDKEYLTQKLIASQAQQLVASQVRNLLDKPADSGESGKNSADSIFGSKDGLKNLLSQAMGKDQSGGQQQ